MTAGPNLLQQDAANRERALALESFIVEAPAGAGKTELLTQRYLKLLAVVQEPEEIVAITFTNKAAAEMRSRILQSLQDVADGVAIDKPHKQKTRELALKALARSAEKQWNLLEQPARLRINTIDSLCSFLARQMPLMSRFGGQPAVVDDAFIHCEAAARRALATLEDEAGDGVVTEALRYLDNDAVRLTDLLARMLAKRDQWLHHTTHVQEDVEMALRQLIQQDIAQAASLLSPDLQQRLMPVARFAASNLECNHLISLLLDWDSTILARPEALPLWRGVCELLLTSGDDFRKALDKRQGFPATDDGRKQKEALLEIIAMLPSPQPLARIRCLPDAQSEEEKRIVAALARLLQLAAAHLLIVFQETGEVDFVEVAGRALAALQDDDGVTDLALKLDYKIQHLLVDEFQDTSPMQVELLRRMTQGWLPDDGRTLFCVGDPMQSIYRFRKADVGLFLQVANYGIGDLQLQRLHLTRNNRSCPAVVDWVNSAFEKMFPKQDDEERGAIRYRPFAATKASEPNEGVLVHSLVLGADSRGDDMAAEEARFLTALIARERALDPKASIAVLVRARAHLEALVVEIRSRHPDLRFQAVEIEQLGGRQTVQDIHALTCALFHRADRVHWLAILRAPWCGLTLADLHMLAADDHSANIWQLMQDEARLSRLSDDGRKRLLHVRDVIAEAYAHQGRQPMRRWVESVWLRLGGAACLWDAGDVRDVQAFLDLLERMEVFDAAQLQSRMEKLYAAPDVQADESLQFMTIHKSKGLEFDTVILPGLHRTSKNGDPQLLLWEEVAIEGTPSQLVAAPYVPRHKRDDLPSTYDYLQNLERERESNETTRVLYVAATRTRRRLHLVGAVRPDGKGEIKAPANSLLRLLWESVGGEFLNAEPRAEIVATETSSAFIPSLVRLPQVAVPELLQSGTPAAVRPAFDEAATDTNIRSIDTSCGTLVHLYLEMMADDGLQDWSSQRLHGLQFAMQTWLQGHGHARDEARQGAERVLHALCHTLDSEAGQWVLASRGSAASELALATADGSQFATYVIDRTFVEDGVRWVIDYKSARLDTVEEDILTREAARYRPQLARYAALFREEGLPIRMAVFFVAYGKLVELD
ncbi:MAG TPA: UvrD-helicase domain-containing protein [Methylophilaceae bacterium]|nr:UvrD-helicase domain-containing protein [Methylophilaceae bacterium]